MPRTCPRCKTAPLKKHKRYCDDCRDGAPPQQAPATRAATPPPPVVRVEVIPQLRKVAARDVVLSCGDVVQSETLWQEQDTHCKKHGDVWVSRIAR